ncbi:hypothetical protein BGI42_09135 [Clostridium taeniosporum]|uniref:Uncharacterized protein n=1 Tax=Clostridium taeniosporum TaxID=394958 RepID=A0A1D7XL99_9CLOT|nr:hypothetical protein BGI42_09135 [Clostridium taeniosporum]
MNIYITNEHFYETWFCFNEGDEKENLIELKDRISASIYTYFNEEIDEIEYVAIKPEEFNLLSYPYSWCDKPIILFSTIGIELSDEVIIKGNSSFDGKAPKGYPNSKIQLEDLTESIIRCACLSINELITYAKYRWCENMGFDYLFTDEALYIEEKIQLGKAKAENLYDEQSYIHYFDDIE